MSNWFESHPTRSIVVYTLLIVGTTWGASRFLLSDGRVQRLHGEIGELKAQLETAGLRSDVERDRIEVLEKQLAEAKNESSRYRDLLLRDPKSFTAMEERLKELEQNASRSSDTLRAHNPQVQDGPYTYRQEVPKGRAFSDPKTGAMLGVQTINYNGSASGTLSLPGNKPVETNAITPAAKWQFKWKSGAYVLRVLSVSYVHDKAIVEVVEESH